MKIRDLLLIGATALSLAVTPTMVLADEAPLPAGGPAAQGEGGLFGLGSIAEIGGVIFVVTVAALVLTNDDSSASTTTS
jgi:hypothetical protein